MPKKITFSNMRSRKPVLDTNDDDDIVVVEKQYQRKTPEELAAEERERVDILKEDRAERYRRRSRRVTSVTLDPEVFEIAKRLGNGNVSRGLDRAIFHYVDCRRVERDERKRVSNRGSAYRRTPARTHKKQGIDAERLNARRKQQ